MLLLLLLKFGWAATCLTCLTLLVHLITSYIKSKPPVQVSLIDLINCDLTYIFYLNFSTMIIVHSLLIAEIAVPPPLACLLAFVADVAVIGVLIYLSIGVVLQFVYMKLRTTHLSESTTDEEARRLILVTIALVSLTEVSVK